MPETTVTPLIAESWKTKKYIFINGIGCLIWHSISEFSVNRIYQNKNQKIIIN